MTLQTLAAGLPEGGTRLNLDHIEDFDRLKENVIAVMNLAGVSFGKGTHYNEQEEEMEARSLAAKALFEMDCGVFLMAHAFDGVTDDAKRTAIKALLMNSRQRYGASALDAGLEMDGILSMASSLPANRMLNLFRELKADRVNNRRTKQRLILALVLNGPNLQWWAVKYRKKLRAALEHAWDKRTASVIRSILNKDALNEEPNVREKAGLEKHIDAFLNAGADRQKVYQCISFILGNREGFSLPLLKAFYAAREDIAKGRMLPPEVLEGIRSTYHPEVGQQTILELTKDAGMTEKKKFLVQRKAKKLDVKVAFNPMARSAVELYILAFAEGMTPAVADALEKKGKAGARKVPVRYGKIGILLDDSFSMTGSETQKLRPMAAALTMKDVLIHAGERHVIKTASGRAVAETDPLLRPFGPTDLAMALVELLQAGVDAVFIVSDGYENAPAGRVDEVMRLLQRIEVRTPVYHVNPVAAAESGLCMRSFSDKIPVLPASNPDQLTLALVRALMETDIKRGIEALAAVTLPKIRAGRLPGTGKEAKLHG